MYKLVCTIDGITKSFKLQDSNEDLVFNDLFEAELHAKQLNKDISYAYQWVPERIDS
ncbi:hypothetical protein MM326_20105 [Alkalihalobacillus sp. LMS6]|uniref:hypothetical protein n=1 Tax=Alkalihalobacillus sp. LMS6 TaxID=2924034 RepID=UPI0020D07511|nr:hypothetical protein [Alkalihalobacillus sp. LMS6]UTR06347.1 hypothetical protein MM326_20105 [Alkalihalobacillus sp. LMS6]